MIVASLLVSAGLLWWIELPTTEETLQVTRVALSAAEHAPKRPPLPVSEGSDAQRLADFQRMLAPIRESTAQVKQLVALTQEELHWAQADFSQLEDPALKLVRLQITVPVTDTYPRMQAAIERALLAFPNLSVDQIQFKRQQVDLIAVEARIRMSLWLQSTSRRSDSVIAAEVGP